MCRAFAACLADKLCLRQLHTLIMFPSILAPAARDLLVLHTGPEG